MGKLHSKHAAVCKPRESPEGDSFVVNACLASKGIDDWIIKQKFYCTGSRLEEQDVQRNTSRSLSPRDAVQEVYGEGMSDEHYRLEVALPPEKTDGEDKALEKSPVSGAAKKRLQFEELQCAVSLEDDHRQEWTFTLYDFDNSGKVTREDITSLLHAIYEVVDASVNHSPSATKALRVKLSVAPDPSQRWKGPPQPTVDNPHARPKADTGMDKKTRAPLRRHHSDHHAQQSCQLHSVDENLERRNHYLDLAGIENYTSRFESGGSAAPARAEHQPRAATQPRSHHHEPEDGLSRPQHLRRLQAPETHGPRLRGPDPGLKQALRSPKVHCTPPGQTPGSGRVVRVRVPPAAQAQQFSVPHKRHKQRVREAQQVRRVPGPLVEKEPPRLLLYEGGVGGGVVQRHEHHHHHQHHHHYHHFYQS